MDAGDTQSPGNFPAAGMSGAVNAARSTGGADRTPHRAPSGPRQLVYRNSNRSNYQLMINQRVRCKRTFLKSTLFASHYTRACAGRLPIRGGPDANTLRLGPRTGSADPGREIPGQLAVAARGVRVSAIHSGRLLPFRPRPRPRRTRRRYRNSRATSRSTLRTGAESTPGARSASTRDSSHLPLQGPRCAPAPDRRA